MPVEITMPQLSDTMTEGTLVKWNKKEGDAIKGGEEIADVETDKATMPMEAFESGVLAHIAVKPGEKVAVGGLLAVIATAGEKPGDVKKQYAGGAAAPAAKAAPKVEKKAEQSAPAVTKSPPAVATIEAASNSEIHEADEVGHGATREAATAVPPVPSHGNGDRVLISPLARKVAVDRKIDINLIKGSGPNGRIVQKDVLTYVPKPAAATGGKSEGKKSKPSINLNPQIAAGQKQVIPLTKLRSVIANRLQQSKQVLPHFYETIDIDVELISQLREQMNKRLEGEGIRLSLGDFVSKAIAVALGANPALNATFDGKEITRHGDVNLGVAVALPEGLIVPVLRGIQSLSLKEIRVRSADLVDRARAQRLKQSEMSGATFSVSNLGVYGIRDFSAIINPPEVAILAVGAAEKRAVVRDDQIVARTMMSATLSCDHRAIDGATAAEFLKTLKQILEEPGLMLV